MNDDPKSCPEPGQIWVHSKQGLRHRITSFDNGLITTWSEPARGPGQPAGYSWLGERTEFEKEFVRL